MPALPNELAEAERAYRKLRLTLILHLVFFLGCCILGSILRRSIGLPPAMLGVVIIVALIVFGGDIFKFLVCRDRLRRLRASRSSS